MKIVILDSYALIEGDMNWQALKEIAHEVVVYGRTQNNEIIPRLMDADYAILNKAYINEEVLTACPKLKWIGVTATGVDTLDIAACRAHNVPVANVPAYSTHSVAQMTFSLLLELCQSAGRYDKSVREGNWQVDIPKSAQILPHMELYGKTIGLIGYGDIAQQVAKIANAFGMTVLCHTRTIRKEYEAHNVKFMPLEEMLPLCHIVSLHCPSTDKTKGIINKDTIGQCKNGVVIINTARGALVNEEDMRNALVSGKVAKFGTDVVSVEPMLKENVLLNAPNVIFTPHIAWATPEALNRLASEVISNLKSFINGTPKNVVN